MTTNTGNTRSSFRDLTGTPPENYERYFVPAISTAVSRGLLDEAALQPGERVVDVACGTGLIARRAAETVGASGSVTGVDAEAGMIEVAASVPAPAAPVIDWRVADGLALPLADASVDVVLCQMGLMFMADRAVAVAEMRRVLAPGGRVVINTPGRIQPPLEALERAIVTHVNADLGGFVRMVFSLHDPEALAALLSDAGFDDVRAVEAEVPFRLPAPADFLWQYVHSTPLALFMADAPEPAKDALEQQVVADWQPFVVDGETRFDQPMVVASGRT